MKMLTEEEFDKLTEDLPEDGFRTLVPLIMESFGKKRGRSLDRIQVATLAVGIMEMGATIDAQVDLIGNLQQQLAQAQQPEPKPEKGRLWTPK